MELLPLHSEISGYLDKHGLGKKFLKQQGLFSKNPFHPSLHTELLEPRHLRVWSFRIDRRYRAIFIFRSPDIVEIIDVNDHYQ